MIRQDELAISPQKTTRTTIFPVRVLNALTWSIARMRTFDPVVKPIPPWYLSIPASEGSYIGEFDIWSLTELSIHGFQDERLQAAAGTMSSWAGYLMSSESEKMGASGSHGPHVLTMLAHEDSVLNGKLQLSDLAKLEPKVVWARAANAWRAHALAPDVAHNYASPKNATLRNALESVEVSPIRVAVKELVACALEHGMPDPSRVSGGTVPSGADPETERRATIARGSIELGKIIWASAFSKVVDSPYIANPPVAPAHSEDKRTIEKSTLLTNLARQQRIAAVWWRCRLELTFYTLRSIVKQLFTKEVLDTLKADNLAHKVDLINRVLERPRSELVSALEAAFGRDTGPSPVGVAPREVVDVDVWDEVVAYVKSAQKGSSSTSPLGLKVTRHPLVETARRFVEYVFPWARTFAELEASENLDIRGAEAALGFRSSGTAVFGTVAPLYGTFNPIYSSGDRLSVSALAPLDLMSRPVWPTVVVTDGALAHAVGAGPHMRALIEKNNFPVNLLVPGATSLPSVYGYAATRERGRYDPSLAGEFNPYAVRAMASYIGQSTERLALGKDADDRLSQWFAAASAESWQEYLERISKRKKHSLVYDANGIHAGAPTVTKQDGVVGLSGGNGALLKLVSSEAYGWYDQMMADPSLYAIELSGLPSVWATCSMAYRDGRYLLEISDAPSVTSAVWRSLEAPVAEFDSTTVLGDMLERLSLLLLDSK